MNIMYVHGFGSAFTTDSTKIQALTALGNLDGPTYDYTATPADVMETLIEFAHEFRPDVIVGTSLGGWYAAELGMVLNVPFVAINPAVRPWSSLKEYVGGDVDHYGRKYYLSAEIVDMYDTIATDGFGLILLDEGDDVIPHTDIDTVDHSFEVIRFGGGSHRFEHMPESLDHIKRHVEEWTLIGNTNDEDAE